MQDTFVTAILPYVVMVGILISGVASIALVVTTFLKTQNLKSDFIPRLVDIESSIRRDASRIDAQLAPVSKTLEPSQDHLAVSELYGIAHDLQDRAGEFHRLLDEIGSELNLSNEENDRSKIVDLGKAVLQTESYLSAVMMRIERQRSEMAEVQSTQTGNRG